MLNPSQSSLSSSVELVAIAVRVKLCDIPAIYLVDKRLVAAQGTIVVHS